MNVDSLSLSSLGNGTRSVPPSHVEYCRCGLMWVGLDWWEDPDWFFGGGREAWITGTVLAALGFGKVH
ncbi:hypothetical protein TNCV_2313731 [Trichonephila clavipes]|nr:hypothetical protein TNCV_2313731 [Trichonephila clavipes]